MAISRKGRLTRVHGQNTRRPTCSRWLPAEKSPAAETKTIVHEYPQTLARGGSPSSPPRQKRKQSYTNTPNTCLRWLTAEKSHAAKTARYVPAPAHSPAVAHRRAPRGRNENNRTQIPRILARGGSPPRNPHGRNENNRTRASQMPARAPCRAGPLASRGSLPFYRNSSERRDSTLGARKSAFTAPSSRTIAREAT